MGQMATSTDAGQLARQAYEASRRNAPEADTLAWLAADAYARTQGYDSANALYTAEGLTCLGRR
jgi:hypothetical protein